MSYVEHRDRPEAAVTSAERLIGVILAYHDVSAYQAAAPVVDAGSMPTDETRALWRALSELASSGGSFDTLRVAQYSGIPAERVETLAGSTFGTLTDVNYHAAAVARHAVRRKLRGHAEGLLMLLDAAPVNVAEQLDNGSTVAEAILAQLRHLEAAMEPPEALRPIRLSDACRAFVERQRAEASTLYPWPGPVYPSVDDKEIQSPGQLNTAPHEPWAELAKVAHMGPESLAVLVGPTGRGKTALALQVAAAVAEAGVRVLYASAELPADELVARVIACRAGGSIPWRAILAASGDKHVKTAAENLAATDVGKNLMLWTPMGRERNHETLDAVARQAEARFIVVDYVQRFVNDSDDKRTAVAKMSGALRDLSRKRQGWPGAAVLALSSVARDRYKAFATVEALRAEPVDDLEGSGKECGELEFDATLLLAYTADRGEEGRAERPACIRVVKQRGGIDGAEVGFGFHAPAGRFTPRKLEKLSEASPKPPKLQGGQQRGEQGADRYNK